jgi:hypothetical protein
VKNVEYLRFGNETVALGSGGSSSSDPPTPPSPPPDENDAPVVVGDSYWTGKNKKLAVGKASGVLANDSDQDGDALSATLVSGSKKGTVKLASDGSFTFTPKKKYTGTTSFKYKVSDGETSSATATVTIKVGGSPPRTGKVASYHDASEDQYPALVGSTAVESFEASSLGKTLAFAAAVTGHAAMLDQLLAAISGLGGSTSDSGLPSADIAATDASSLPDFLAALSSEFGLV